MNNLNEPKCNSSFGCFSHPHGVPQRPIVRPLPIRTAWNITADEWIPRQPRTPHQHTLPTGISRPNLSGLPTYDSLDRTTPTRVRSRVSGTSATVSTQTEGEMSSPDQRASQSSSVPMTVTIGRIVTATATFEDVTINTTYDATMFSISGHGNSTQNLNARTRGD